MFPQTISTQIISDRKHFLLQIIYVKFDVGSKSGKLNFWLPPNGSTVSFCPCSHQIKLSYDKRKLRGWESARYTVVGCKFKIQTRSNKCCMGKSTWLHSLPSIVTRLHSSTFDYSYQIIKRRKQKHFLNLNWKWVLNLIPL